MNTSRLTPTQSHALFDVLTHHEVYAEISDFKYPGAIHKYGPPFQNDRKSSTSPVLQALVSRFVLDLPGLKEITPDFWKVRIDALIDELAACELSESYDKGVLGVRKTLSTAISALIEYPARGCLGGIEERRVERREYDLQNPEHVLQSWRDCLQEVVYGNLVDELFDKVRETDQLEDHTSLVRGMHEFIVVNIASLLHYTLVLSPEGPTLLRMIENVHRLIPYVMVRQTLKIGNVATMINAMVKVVLAKVSVGSVTNWIGWSSGADEGMNLLQQIISQVLGWDKRDLKHRADKLEKDKDAPPKAVREALKDWIHNSSREEHEECRRMSRDQSLSIVAVILSLSSSSTSADELSEAQHANSLKWLSLKLAVRDRTEIVRVLCHGNPDHLTAAINEAVTAYTPMIRRVHNAVNLADTVWDFERFVTDMLKMSKPSSPQKGAEEKPPSVEDFVDLLNRHQKSTHKFLHQVCKNEPELASWWRQYVHMATAQFKKNDKPPSTVSVVKNNVAAGGIFHSLDETFTALPEEDKQTIINELENYDKYLRDLHAASAARISAVIKRTHSTPYGPGAFLARWQNLLDSTLITPATAKGKVRLGANKTVKEEGRKDDVGFVTEGEVEKIVDDQTPNVPDMKRTLEVFAQRFREELGGAQVRYVR